MSTTQDVVLKPKTSSAESARAHRGALHILFKAKLLKPNCSSVEASHSLAKLMTANAQKMPVMSCRQKVRSAQDGAVCAWRGAEDEGARTALRQLSGDFCWQLVARYLPRLSPKASTEGCVSTLPSLCLRLCPSLHGLCECLDICPLSSRRALLCFFTAQCTLLCHWLLLFSHIWLSGSSWHFRCLT